MQKIKHLNKQIHKAAGMQQGGWRLLQREWAKSKRRLRTGCFALQHPPGQPGMHRRAGSHRLVERFGLEGTL